MAVRLDPPDEEEAKQPISFSLVLRLNPPLKNTLYKNILAKPEYDCNMLSVPSSPALPPPIDAHQIEEAQMTRFKFLLFAALLIGFAALAHAGFDDGKAAYHRGDYATAYKGFKPLAEQGDTHAQFLGFINIAEALQIKTDCYAGKYSRDGVNEYVKAETY